MDFQERKKLQEKKKQSDFVDKIARIIIELNYLIIDNDKVLKEEGLIESMSDFELKTEISDSTFFKWQKNPERLKALINVAVKRKLVKK